MEIEDLTADSLPDKDGDIAAALRQFAARLTSRGMTRDGTVMAAVLDRAADRLEILSDEVCL